MLNKHGTRGECAKQNNQKERDRYRSSNHMWDMKRASQGIDNENKL